MNKTALTLIKKNFHSLEFKAGERIFAKGDIARKAYMVLGGMVSIVAFDHKGKRRRLFSAQKGDIFPTGWLEKGSIRAEYDYEAFGDAVCAVIEKKAFDGFAKKHPEAILDILIACDNRLSFAKHRIETLVQERAENKILYLFRYMAERASLSKIEGEYVRVKNSLTQQEIGESLGLSRESASISFRKMYKNGLLKRTDDGQLLIHKEMLHKSL